jgi:hypothetical protein
MSALDRLGHGTFECAHAQCPDKVVAEREYAVKGDAQALPFSPLHYCYRSVLQEARTLFAVTARSRQTADPSASRSVGGAQGRSCRFMAL